MITDYTNYDQMKDGSFADWKRYQTPILAERISAMQRKCGKRGCVLDVGAGRGLFASMARVAGMRVDCVEPSEIQAAELTRSGFKVYRDIRDVPLCHYSGVHLSHILEHVEKPVAFIMQCANTLVSGGGIWIEVPGEKHIERLCKLHRYFEAWRNPYHCHHFTRRSLHDTMRRACLGEVRTVHEGCLNKRRAVCFGEGYPLWKRIAVTALSELLGGGGAIVSTGIKEY